MTGWTAFYTDVFQYNVDPLRNHLVVGNPRKAGYSDRRQGVRWDSPCSLDIGRKHLGLNNWFLFRIRLA